MYYWLAINVSLFSGDGIVSFKFLNSFMLESGEPANIEDSLRAELWGIESKSVLQEIYNSN